LELIGCEDEPSESRAILRMIKKLQASGRAIAWRGHVREEDLHAAYQSATFTVFPSKIEGFGLPIVESLWHGRPVICSGESAMGEVSQGNGCCQVDINYADSLAAAMERLLRDESLCLTLAEAAYHRPFRSWADYWRDFEPLLERPRTKDRAT
jgi:glycosyltransferase involved in cell wall biosynthesis